MNPPPRACIFDFDGVLADTERLHWQALQDVLVPLGAGCSWETYARDYIGFDDRDAVRAALARVGKTLSAEETRDILQRKAGAFLRRVAGADVPPLPGAVEAVRAAAAAGPVALCTGAVASDVHPLLQAFGLLDVFNAVITADDVTRSKPDPESYRLAAARLGVPPAECLAIEDTPHGLQAARKAGCQTLAVAQTHPAEALAPWADAVIPDITKFRLG